MRGNFFWTKSVEVYQQTFSVLKINPIIWIPFLLIGVLDFLALAVLFFAPSPPFSYILGPIIERLWSWRYLHYPDNFLLLPKLFHHAHVAIVSIAGVFVTGLAIKRIELEATGGARQNTFSLASFVAKHYFSLVAAWVISYAVFTFALKLVFLWLPRIGLIQILGAFLFGLALQALFAFFLPAIILFEKGFLRGLWKGLVLGYRNFGTTVTILFLPMFVMIALSFIKSFNPYLVKWYPESVLWVLAIGIVVTLIVDILVTSATTILFLKVRNQT